MDPVTLISPDGVPYTTSNPVEASNLQYGYGYRPAPAPAPVDEPTTAPESVPQPPARSRRGSTETRDLPVTE